MSEKVLKGEQVIDKITEPFVLDGVQAIDKIMERFVLSDFENEEKIIADKIMSEYDSNTSFISFLSDEIAKEEQSFKENHCLDWVAGRKSVRWTVLDLMNNQVAKFIKQECKNTSLESHIRK